MEQLTRKENLAAYDSLDDLISYAESYEEAAGFKENEIQIVAHSLRKDIENALPSMPPRTMLEIDWDSDEHRLAEAEHIVWGKVIMLFASMDTGNIFVKTDNEKYVYATPATLTPTGRKYEFKEIDNA